MSLTATDQRFARRTGTLWRDTGQHVLALPQREQAERDRAEVVILGGGSAVLWRVLARRLTLAEILDCLVTSDDQGAPGEHEVLACLQDLVSRGLIDDHAERPE